MIDEGKIRELQSILDKKIKDANDQARKIQEYNQKSHRDDQEIKFLRDEIDKERRKSSADEGTIKKLEYILAEKLRIIQEGAQRNTALESEIVDLRNEIEKERNKSLADEATIRKLETILK